MKLEIIWEIFEKNWSKSKVKFTLEQAMKAQKGSRGVVLFP